MIVLNYYIQMSCRESRRARIDELFHEYEADITKLTQINEWFQIFLAS